MVEFKARVEEVKLEIAKQGYSIQQFAKLIGYNRDYINQVVNGRRSPSPKTASIISKTLGRDVEELFTITMQSKEVKS